MTYIAPSWEVFGPCPRCGAADGMPCQSRRWLQKGYTLGSKPPKPLRNPHPGRKQVRN